MKESFGFSQAAVTQGFGERLAQERREKSARERRDIKQKEIAKAIGSSEPSVSRWETGIGVPSERMIERLAAYFGVTPAWLRYGQEPRTAFYLDPEPVEHVYTDAEHERRAADVRKAAGSGPGSTRGPSSAKQSTSRRPPRGGK